MVARELAVRTRVPIVSVGYSLAGPGVTYPLLHRQVGAGFAWVHEHAADIGVDADRVQFGGASAGGNLVLGAVLGARERGSAIPAGLQLVYPMLHHVTPPGDVDHAAFPEVLGIGQASVDAMFTTYTGGRPDQAPYASIEHHDLAGLPPTLVVVSEFDDLRPSGEDAARRLEDAGVPVTRYLARGMVHGQLSMPATTAETDRTLQVMADFLLR